MLNTIKSMIQQKKSFQEASDLIMEDVNIFGISDSVVFGEDVDNDNDDDNNEENSNNLNNNIETSDENNMDDESNDISQNNTDNSILDNPIEDDKELPIPGNNELLPNPTDNNINNRSDDYNDILSADIDLTSNTMKDILPVPPSNAGDSVVSNDTVNQHIDSGFGNENDDQQSSNQVLTNDILDVNIDEIPSNTSNNISVNAMSEAITVGDDNSEDSSQSSDNSTETAEDKPETTEQTPETTEEEPGDTTEEPKVEDNNEESPVTSAVKDKIAEMDIEDDIASKDSSKDELLKKLGNITKSLEDAKKAVMNSMN